MRNKTECVKAVFIYPMTTCLEQIAAYNRDLYCTHTAAGGRAAEHATESKQTNASKHQNVPKMELPVQIASGVLAETPTRRQSYSSMHAMRLGIILVLPAGSVCPASLTGP